MFPLALLRTTQWAPCTRRSRCRRHQQGLATSPTGPTQRVLSPDAAFPVKRPQPPSLRRPIRLRGVTVILTCRRAAAQRRPLPLQPSAFPTWRWLVGCPGCLLGSEMLNEVPIAQDCAFSGGVSHSYPRDSSYVFRWMPQPLAGRQTWGSCTWHSVRGTRSKISSQ